MNNDQYAESALDELKNNVLLLTLANNYLIDDIFLTKIGNNISRAVEILERDIVELKREYPGKFVYDIDTESILEKIDKVAQKMLRPGKEIKDNHASGALGREMESHFMSIKKAVEDIKLKVRGAYHDQRKGPAIDISGSIQSVFQSVGSMLILGIKVLACIIVLAGVVFVYLFLTIEKETTYVNEIRISSALIKDKKDQVASLEKEKQDLVDKRESLNRTYNMSRQEKVEALELEVEIRKVEDKINQLEAEISVQENKRSDNQDKLDTLRNKTFIRKLLKQ